MGVTEWVLVGVVVLAVALVVLWSLATRVDRLHRTVLRSRVTLETQLVRRAQAATELAGSGVLDPAEALVVSDVALRAIDAAPLGLVHDGLEGRPVALDEEPAAPDGGAFALGGGAALAPDDGASPAAVDRGLIESELSRTLRTVLGPPEERAELTQDPRATAVLDQLDQAWYRLQLARRFHNARVVQVRHLRANPVVRLFHLAGRAPLPEPFDMDDARPED